MRELAKYIEDTIGVEIKTAPVPKNQLGNIPLYISASYKLYRAELMGHKLILAEPVMPDDLSILQTQKNFHLLKEYTGHPVVLVVLALQAYNRKRLVESKVNFIVPGKQLYLPELLMDMRETFPRVKSKKRKLIPTAQFLLIYHILHRDKSQDIEQYPFKDLAKKMGYTAMAISKAVDNLDNNGLIRVEGSKEKNIHFNMDRKELWDLIMSKDLWIDPVIKRMYVEDLPKNVFLKCNESALPAYSEMNPSRQLYYAIEKTAFYALQRNNELTNLNDYGGRYCLEVWKYNPVILVDELNANNTVVDPLSLYLSLKEIHDERIEMALEQIIKEFIW